MIKAIPVFASELIQELDSQYPHRCPGLKDKDREIWMYAGKRELIDMLVRKLEKTGTENLKEIIV